MGTHSGRGTIANRRPDTGRFIRHRFPRNRRSALLSEATFVPPPPIEVPEALGALEHFYQRPILNVAEVEKPLGVTYAAANGLVSRLSDLGILQEITGQKRHRIFRYAPYLNLFSD